MYLRSQPHKIVGAVRAETKQKYKDKTLKNIKSIFQFFQCQVEKSQQHAPT
jgi:hypothetical protein